MPEDAQGLLIPIDRQFPQDAPRSLSKGDVIYRAIRTAIMAGELPPGASIDKNELRRRFGVSRLPITTAVNRLAFERLVVVEPQHGSFVARIDIDDVRQWAFARRALEVEIAAECARHVTDAVARQLANNLRYQRAAISGEDYTAFLQLDIAFHRSLVEASGLERIGELLESIRAHLDRVRRLLLPEPGRMQSTLAEHRRVAEAIRRGAPVEAADAMRDHLDSTLARLFDFEQRHPEAFRP